MTVNTRTVIPSTQIKAIAHSGRWSAALVISVILSAVLSVIGTVVVVVFGHVIISLPLPEQQNIGSDM